MSQILFFILGIAGLIVIPFVYFSVNKYFSQSATKKDRFTACYIIGVVILVLIIVGSNLYTYLINSQNNIVSERYIKSLLINSANNNLDKHIADTAYISYVDVEGLYDAFVISAKFDVKSIKKIAASQRQWICDQGYVHHYMYLEEYDLCYDIGLLKKENFWDVAFIDVLSETDKKEVLTYEIFINQ